MSSLTLAKIAHVVMGQSPDGAAYNRRGNGIPLLNGPAEFGDATPIAVQWTTEATKIAEIGDILFCVRGNTLGRQNIADQPYAVGRGLAAIRAQKGKADTAFIGLWLRYKAESLLAAGTGSTFPSISGDYLESLLFPNIGESKQRQVAARLNSQLAEVEKALRAVEVQSHDANALKSKALEVIFGGIENRQAIGSAARLQSGYAFKSDAFKKSGVRLLRNANILPNKVYWDDTVFLSEQASEKYLSYRLSDGDVLISLDRPVISSGIKVARVGSDDLPALLVQRVGRFLIDPEKLDAEYLYAYLQTDLFISQISGHDQSLGVPHISPLQVESVEIPLPEVSVQRQLSKKLVEVTCAWREATIAIQAQLKDLAVLPKTILAQTFDHQEDKHD